MRNLVTVCGVVLFLAGGVGNASAQEQQTVRPWWVGLDMGYGRLQFSSDQSRSGPGKSTFALGFEGGHTLGRRARIGVELNGWLEQAYNLQNPTVGESVSNALVIFDAFPIGRSPLFVRGGAGVAMYDISRPEDSGSTGWAWTAGVGYEAGLTPRLKLVPLLSYASGNLGEGYSAAGMQTGRRYSVIEMKVGVKWQFGKPGTGDETRQ